eukprot:177585_1
MVYIAKHIEFKNGDKLQKYKALNWNNIAKQIDIMQCFLPSHKNENNVNKLCEYIIQQSDLVFTHGDLLGGNILYLTDTKEIKFVDFEYGAYNYRAFDFANHFCEYAGFDCDWKRHFPNRDHIKEFINNYIETLCNGKDINENIINLFNKQNGFNNNNYNEFLDSPNALS